jgi:hypothetical protein
MLKEILKESGIQPHHKNDRVLSASWMKFNSRLSTLLRKFMFEVVTTGIPSMKTSGSNFNPPRRYNLNRLRTSLRTSIASFNLPPKIRSKISTNQKNSQFALLLTPKRPTD